MAAVSIPAPTYPDWAGSWPLPPPVQKAVSFKQIENYLLNDVIDNHYTRTRWIITPELGELTTRWIKLLDLEVYEAQQYHTYILETIDADIHILKQGPILN